MKSDNEHMGGLCIARIMGDNVMMNSRQREIAGMECWDVLDVNREKTGKTIVRGDAFAKGEYHLIVHVWIKGSDGNYVISKRNDDKYPYPGSNL